MFMECYSFSEKLSFQLSLSSVFEFFLHSLSRTLLSQCWAWSLPTRGNLPCPASLLKERFLSAPFF